MMFSVVVPTCLGGPLLERCLNSLIEWGPPQLQIVVVFDGPSRFETRLPSDLPKGMKLESVALPHPTGFCRAINRGLAQARFPIAQALNDDAFVLAGWYERPMIAFHRPDIGAVAPLILKDQKEGKQKEAKGDPEYRFVDSAGDTMNPLGVIRKRFRGQDRSRVEKVTTEVLACGGCAGFFRTEALNRVGSFPEDFGAYFDDVEVSLSLRRLGYRILFEPASVVIHSGGQSYGLPRGTLLTQQARNEELVYWRNLPAPLWFFMALPRFWLLAVRSIVHLARGSLGAWLLGKGQALCAIGSWPPRQPFSQRDDSTRVKAWRHWRWID